MSNFRHHLSRALSFFMLPWTALLLPAYAVVVFTVFSGGHKNGGMAGLFRLLADHPHASFLVFMVVGALGLASATGYLLGMAYQVRRRCNGCRVTS